MTPLPPARQALGERSSNIPSPVKSPSKIPLPPSPSTEHEQLSEDLDPAPLAEQDGVMLQVAKASSFSQKPALVRKISEAYSSGQAYVSPSDNILSPTTKKLYEVKMKRFGTFKKTSSSYNPQNLFASSKPGQNDRAVAMSRDR